ncbi:MAG: TIGR00289 family protein [Candidatus Altiarchaeales archaeon ex4484_96]|nr:MAG: TIGR00289 family protein [Candidatus Altiarchaeales archaeon ex4484_96]
MKLCTLYSGGKDSNLAHYRASMKHDTSVLLSMVSDRADSYMYHTPNIHLTGYQARAMNTPLVSRRTSGVPPQENTDLTRTLKEIKKEYDIRGVCVGAVRSNYQHRIVSEVCRSLNLEVCAPLWHADHEQIVRELIDEKFEVIVVAVAAEGLGKGWLGRKLDLKALEELVELNRINGVDVGGEGGEYETLVLDGPLFKRKLEIISAKRIWDKIRGELVVDEVKLVDK